MLTIRGTGMFTFPYEQRDPDLVKRCFLFVFFYFFFIFFLGGWGGVGASRMKKVQT